MAEISGTEGGVSANGIELEASEWSFDGDQAVIDRSNFTTLGEPANASGQRTGNVSMSGPVSTTSNLFAKGVTRGTLVTFKLRATPNLFLQVRARVSKFNANNNKDNGPGWSISGAQYGAVTIVGI